MGGTESDNTKPGAGAGYLFVRNAAGDWSQQLYVKASNSDPNDRFGRSSRRTVAVYAPVRCAIRGQQCHGCQRRQQQQHCVFERRRVCVRVVARHFFATFQLPPANDWSPPFATRLHVPSAVPPLNVPVIATSAWLSSGNS